SEQGQPRRRNDDGLGGGREGSANARQNLGDPRRWSASRRGLLHDGEELPEARLGTDGGRWRRGRQGGRDRRHVDGYWRHDGAVADRRRRRQEHRGRDREAAQEVLRGAALDQSVVGGYS